MTTPRPPISRRAFVRAGAASALSAASYRRALGANDRVGVGFIGFGLIGRRHVLDFLDQPDVDAVAVAEAHRGRLDEASALIGGRARGFDDFRRLIDDPDVQAVVVSTPDHWHALMTMMACAAGKDVYVEKPLALTVREGRRMVDVARRHGRVVQVGTQQRSGPHYRRARDLIRSGHIGPVRSVRMTAYRNVMPGFGSPPDEAPPPGFDWPMFLGPAPMRPYNRNRGIYHFRWFWDSSGGQMTNLGQHSIDILDWFLDGPAPRSVMSVGGRYSLADNGETPDQQDALFDYGGFTAVWSHREASQGVPPAFPLEFFGPKGSLSISRRGFVVVGDREVPPESLVPSFGGSDAVRPPAPAEAEDRTASLVDRSGDVYDQFRRHVRDFLDCVKSRSSPLSDLESAHRTATACHLANIALRVGRPVRWDAEAEAILGDPEASALLDRPYRSPWDAVRDGLMG